MGPIIPAAAGIGLLYLLQHMGSAAGQSASPEDLARRDDNEYKDNPEMDPRAIDARHPQSPQPQAQQEPQNATVQQLEQQMTAADPVPPVTTQALPQQAQRASAVSPNTAKPPAVTQQNVPDSIMQGNIDKESAIPQQAAGNEHIDGHDLLSSLLPLLGAMPLAGGAPVPGSQELPSPAQRPALPAPAKTLQLTGPDVIAGQAPNEQKALPREVQGPPNETAAAGTHIKSFNVGGKSYFIDQAGQVYDAQSNLLGDANKVFKSAQLKNLVNAGLLLRAVK